MRISQPKAGIVLHTADPIINYTLRLCSSQRLSAPGELPRRESGQLFFLLSSSSSVFLRDYRLLILPCYLQSRLPYITITSTNVMGSSSELDTDTSLPDGAWDSHVHIADEVSNQLDNHTPEKERKRKMHRASFNIQSPIHVLQDKFPYHPSHPYRPKKADLDDLLTFQQTQGITHSCLVAFSVYHTDNSILLDALRRLNINGSRGRAVACVDSQTVTDTELQDLHNAGVRGIRLNFRTSSIRLDDDDDAFAILLTQAADRIRPFGWVLQLYVSLDQIAQFAAVVPRLGVSVVIDHLGHPDPSGGPPRLQRGYKEFMHLLGSAGSGRVYTKLSGVYRFDDLPELDSYVQDILAAAPDRVVWASDWPHSGGVSGNPNGDRHRAQQYRKVDDQRWIAQCKTWCRLVGQNSSDELVRKIWVDNPRRLWQYDEEGTKSPVRSTL